MDFYFTCIFVCCCQRRVLYIAKNECRWIDRFCFPARTSMSASVVRDLVRSYAHPVHLNSNGHVYDHLIKAIGLSLALCLLTSCRRCSHCSHRRSISWHNVLAVFTESFKTTITFCGTRSCHRIYVLQVLDNRMC